MAKKPESSYTFNTLDRDLGRLQGIENGIAALGKPRVAFGLSVVFIVFAGLIAALFFGGDNRSMVVIAAAAIGGYMALNIGANDVANNMGPAVGAGALSMGGAILIAVVFEAAGALLAGGDVVSTISKGIIDPETMADNRIFVWAMMAALLSAALWINLATWVGAPVSTTHSVVGGVVGAGVAAAGMSAVNWPVMGKIAASWVISPMLGGLIAAGFLALIKSQIIYKEDKIAASRKWVPILIAIMAGAFGAYLSVKGLKKIISIPLSYALLIGLVSAVLAWVVSKPIIARQSEGLENRNKSVKVLFGIPLVISAALLSFAHGANDVANAVGPLAAIVHAESFGEFAGKVIIPLWVMAIGALGISFGLVFFGPKLIRMVGSQITKLNQMRAYCVALSAAITVIVASWLGLPVSSTHIAVGAVFGVGFYREWEAERRAKTLGVRSGEIDPVSSATRKKRKLVRRNHVMTILAAWVITVPAAALISALIFTILRAGFP